MNAWTPVKITDPKSKRYLSAGTVRSASPRIVNEGKDSEQLVCDVAFDDGEVEAFKVSALQALA